MYPLLEQRQVFCDAFLANERSSLLFCSLWGRDTSIQQLRAMLTLPTHEGGIDQLSVSAESNQRHKALIDSPDRLTYQAGRQHTQQFGELVNVWLYDPIMEKPDTANRQAYWVKPLLPGEPAPQEVPVDPLWPLVKQLTHLPLEDDWRKPIVREFVDNDWITRLDGLRLCAYEINLSGEDVKDQVESVIVNKLKNGVLT